MVSALSDLRDRPQDDAALFAELYPALRRLAGVVGPPEIDPDDLVQEALVRVLRSGLLIRLTNPRAYLCRAVVHLAANQRRSLGRRRRAVDRLARELSTGSEPVYPSDLSELQRLGPAERAVLFLHDVEGLSYEETALILGIGQEAARQRVSRARRHLRAQLQEG